jgi:hypothetical protein
MNSLIVVSNLIIFEIFHSEQEYLCVYVYRFQKVHDKPVIPKVKTCIFESNKHQKLTTIDRNIQRRRYVDHKPTCVFHERVLLHS